MLGNAGYGQTSTSSTPDDRATLISKCEKAKDEVIVSRALIASLEDTIAKQEVEQTMTDAELAKVREALAHERKALAESEAAVKEYKKALAKMTKKKNFFKSLSKVLGITTVTLAAVAATVILKE